MINSFAPVHPGEILRHGFLAPTRLSAHALARVIDVPPGHIERIASEEAPITTDTAMRLARYFGTTVQFWMGLQAQHDLEYARQLVGRDRERPQLQRVRVQAAADLAPGPELQDGNKHARKPRQLIRRQSPFVAPAIREQARKKPSQPPFRSRDNGRSVRVRDIAAEADRTSDSCK